MKLANDDPFNSVYDKAARHSVIDRHLADVDFLPSRFLQYLMVFFVLFSQMLSLTLILRGAA